MVLPAAAESQEWIAGVVGGGISADLVGDDIPDPRWGPRLTVASGAIVEFWPLPSLGARLEALYVLRGTHFRDEDELFEQRSAYLQFPLLVTLGAALGSRLTVRTFAGPALSFLVRCRIVTGFRPLRTANDPGPAFREYSQDCNHGPLDYPTRTSDLSLLLGGGAAVGLGRVRLLLEGRLDRGLRSIVPPEFDLDIRNRSYGVFVGLLYQL